MEDFFQKHSETGQLVMLLQEEIIFDEYYRCYCIGGKYVRIMPYEPRNPHHLRYVSGFLTTPGTVETNGRDRTCGSINISVTISIQLNWQCAMAFLMRLIFVILLRMQKKQVWAKIILTGWWKQQPIMQLKKRWPIEPGRDNLTWGEYVKRSANQNN